MASFLNTKYKISDKNDGDLSNAESDGGSDADSVSDGGSDGGSDAESDADSGSGGGSTKGEDPSEKTDDDDDSDTDDEDYLHKLDDSVRKNIIGEYHPEMIQHNDEEVETLCKIVRDEDGTIIDPFHKTLPFVTKYEKARILGERAKHINSGAKPFITIEKHIIDGYLIALREFEEKKIPFIIRRPLPNGGSEYWKLADLQIIE